METFPQFVTRAEKAIALATGAPSNRLREEWVDKMQEVSGFRVRLDESYVEARKRLIKLIEKRKGSSCNSIRS